MQKTHQSKWQSTPQIIPRLKDTRNNLVSNPKEIKHFLHLFTPLYAPLKQVPIDDFKMLHFFKQFTQPISEDLASELERPVDLAEM